MCWSRFEREEWLRRQREEREPEHLQTISSEPEAKEPVEPEIEEREGELVRA